jgi:8-oxo-dGTP pyrophosphatase MutT (NUDIX family)
VQRYSGNALQQAAVLIPVICRPVPTLLLTRRADMLRKHSGQVAFPGGVTEAEDSSPIVTALREAQEEINIDPLSVIVLGQLIPLESVSGYQVTPVVGLVPPDLLFQGRHTEVKDFFEIPLQEALQLSRYYPLTGYYAGTYRRVYLSWYEDKFIWGLTAAIIYQLANQVNQ